MESALPRLPKRKNGPSEDSFIRCNIQPLNDNPGNPKYVATLLRQIQARFVSNRGRFQSLKWPEEIGQVISLELAMKRKCSSISTLVMAVAIAAGSWSSGSFAMKPDSASLATAVMAGKDIHVTLDLSLCTEPGTLFPGPAHRGSVHPDAFMVLKDGTVAFSNTHFTVRSDDRPVQEFMKYRVHPDGKVELQVIVLDAGHLLNKKQYDCAVSHGVSFYW